MGHVAKIFKLNRQGFNVKAGAVGLVIAFVPLIVLGALDKESYFLSVAFAAAFTAASDPGGAFRVRIPRLALVGVSGALLTTLAFSVTHHGWGLVALAAFAVTLAAGLMLAFGPHRFFAAYLINIWFVIALSLGAQYQLEGTAINSWAQGLAWLIGSVLWVAFAATVWLIRGRRAQTQLIPEISGDTTRTKLSRPQILFMLIRALALTIAVAISFGLKLPNADWMPIATIVAMKPDLQEAELVAAQRLVGALLGALLATIVLLTVSDKNVLGGIIVALAAAAGAIRFVNYALYSAAVAALVLIATDLPHPSNLSAEGRRVIFTFIGVGIAVAVTLLAGVLAKRDAAPATR